MEKNRKRRKCGIEGQVNKVSGDLISRKVLIADMKSRKYIDKALCEIFETVVDEAPTAFDKEKVIEELEDYLFEKYCVEGDEKIAEIVEKGGIE